MLSMRKKLIIALSLFFVGCSVSVRMKMNGEKKFTFEIDGVKIEMTSRIDNATIFNLKLKIISGNFDLFPNKFILFTTTEGIDLDDAIWFLNGERIDNQIHVHLKEGDILQYYFSFSRPDVNKWIKTKDIKFTIPPNSSLQHNSKDVIQHKVELTIRDKREKN